MLLCALLFPSTLLSSADTWRCWILQYRQRLRSALTAERKKNPCWFSAELSYPCIKPYVYECICIKFLCSSSFLCKFAGRMEHWIIAAQHADFHLHGQCSFCLHSVRPPLQAFRCLNPHCASFDFWLPGMNLSPCILHLLGNLIFRHAWRILRGPNSSEEQRVSGFSKVTC